MSPRRLIAVGVFRGRRWHGSVLPEPSVAAVYEDRLPQGSREPAARREPVGVNFLDGQTAVSRWRMTSPSMARLVVSEAASMAAWVPWCVECQQPPAGGPWTLGNAEYLARQHDIVHHRGAWTAQAAPAAEVAALVAALPGRGVW